MLLNEFQEIIDQIMDIDTDIGRLHEKIGGLYDRRNALFSVKSFDMQRDTYRGALPLGAALPYDNSALSSLSWEESEYTRLVFFWSDYGVALPPYKVLMKKLAKAKLLIDELSLSGHAFQLLVVPPSNIVDLNHPFMRKHTIVFSDSLKKEVGKTMRWKVYIVAVNPLPYASLTVNGNDIVLAGYHMPGLNVSEYAMLVATSHEIIDQEAWSLILREHQAASNLIPCVSHIGNMYRFDTDYADALIGDNTFRPAMEIN